MKALILATSLSLNTLAPISTLADQSVQAPKELNMSLEYLTLTPKEVKQRDKLLAPVYDNYTNVTISSVANALEKAYGMNIYHHQIGKEELLLNNKKSVMENAVRYYMGEYSLFKEAASGVVSHASSVRTKHVYNNYSSTEPKLSLSLIEGNTSKFDGTYNLETFSLLTTLTRSKDIEFLGFGPTIGNRKAVYSSVQAKLYTAPVMNDFMEALKVSNIKALDATVTFLIRGVDNNDKKYTVIYPSFNKLAPIPQASIFISPDATVQDMVDMLNEHAPKIYAYNKLFNANLLPSVAEINALLAKYPNILAEVEKKVGKVKRENIVNAIQASFLTVTYGTAGLIAAPIALSAVMASAILAPVLISAVSIAVVATN